MKTIFNKSLLSLAVISGISGLYVPTALAAEDDSNTEVDEVIQVKGFRSSLIQARDLKRDAIGSQDSIVAEDIADFPDLNLADSLQRVPGIAITREGGEGRNISLRGLGPDFARVQVNGMEGLATSASAMDSRGSVTRSRAFDFNIFASELFNQIDVKKSYQASLDEGGIGGTVNLRSAKPFDYDGFTAAANGQLGTNSQAGEIDPRASVIISNTWGDFGALVSASYSKRHINEQGYNSYRWRTRTVDSDGYSDSLSQEVKDALEAGEIYFNRGNRYSVWENTQQRTGLTTALQYRPSKNLSFELDILYSELENDRQEFHLPTAGSSSTALGYIDALEIIPASDGDGYEAVYGEFSGTTLRTETREDLDKTEFTQITLSNRWVVSDNLILKGLIGHSESDFSQPKLEKFYTETVSDITTDFRGDRRFDPVNTYSIDTADVSNWTFREIDLKEDYITNTFDVVSVDGNYVLTDDAELKFGFSLKEFENSQVRRLNNDLGRNQDTPVNNDVRTIDQFAYTYTEHDSQDWIGIDFDKALDFYGVDTDLGDEHFVSSASGVVQEDTNGAYVEYEWSQYFSDSVLRGNIGLRYYDTEITSSGIVSGSDVAISSDYNGVLPTLNLAWEPTDEIVVRFSAAKNITRPSLDALTVSGNVQVDPDGSRGLSIQAGNPGLQPFESINYDTSFEWYFSEEGSFAAGLFLKKIDNFVFENTVEMPYSETGFPLSLLDEASGQTGDTQFSYSRPENGQSTDIKGLELSYQTLLGFLPSPFNNIGIVTNYTYADADFLYENVQGSGESQYKKFPGLSKNSYNFTVFYETEKWGGRIAAASRSDYISLVEGGLADEDERGFHGTTFVDMSVFYQVNDSLKLTLEGVNLTDETDEQYSDRADRIYNVTTSGRTFYLGASYKF
ncbi:TonB-dependent receptor [Catenovulum adriaticum]|uniref:TonB-dependent receptor n=1 Tax=Catenovulum adriaticum TaxID=2984846 RepID=A0ABY7AU43_9ALTE|nr:TonB-dependent receptor [Catenovulum sp. TS8]WAJ72166.1 TonB-dependent receptor [Catenovulum sp. TS8]